MVRYVLKFYKRPPDLNASKVIDRAFFEAPDKETAMRRAKALFDASRETGAFPMLFIENGDVVWISEPGNP